MVVYAASSPCWAPSSVESNASSNVMEGSTDVQGHCEAVFPGSSSEPRPRRVASWTSVSPLVQCSLPARMTRMSGTTEMHDPALSSVSVLMSEQVRDS